MNKLGRKTPELLEIRIAYVSGILPYLNKANKISFYRAFYDRMQEVGRHWTANKSHGSLLRELQDIGGLKYIPEELRYRMLEWLVLVYIGERGGYGFHGRYRKVFYSNSGAPLAYEIIKNASDILDQNDILDMKEKSSLIKARTEDKYVDRRFEELVDLLNMKE